MDSCPEKGGVAVFHHPHSEEETAEEEGMRRCGEDASHFARR